MKAEYFIPRTQETIQLENVKDEVDLIEQIKATEGIKRIPQTWLIWYMCPKTNQMLQLNRNHATRLKAERDAKARKAARG